MRLFKVTINRKINMHEQSDDNWAFTFAQYSFIKIATLKGSTEKEIAHSGKNFGKIYYSRPTVHCVGIVTRDGSYRGIAFFNLVERLIFISLLILGIACNASNIIECMLTCLCVIFGFIVLLDFICKSKDDIIFAKIKNKLQM